MQQRPSLVRMYIDNAESQTLWPTGMEMIYKVTINSGEHVIQFNINNPSGVVRIEECSLLGG
jgi:hypothetical protein